MNSWKRGVAAVLGVLIVGTGIPDIGYTPVLADGQTEKISQTGNEYNGTTYYIDAENGSDEADGRSADNAWKTFKNIRELRLTSGDRLLLKAGCVWNNEQLQVIEAHGSKESPIVIGKYGEGDNPLINGNGNSWLEGAYVSAEKAGAVHIYNSDHFILENLDVTNWETDSADLLYEEGAEKQQSKYLLTGIVVENHDGGHSDGVIIRNNHVFDVNGKMEAGANKGTGGIVVMVTGNEVISSFENLQICGNEVNNVCHEGIYTSSSWGDRTLVGGEWSQEVYKRVGWENMYIANNYVHEIAGDGIVMISADNGMAEKNLVIETADEAWNYSRNPAHAAIWMWNCDNVTMQYNEAAYTESYQDGMAFDFDYGNQNILYQYNYSHDNKGGFLMSCPGPYFTVNVVARYNVSANDGLFDGCRLIRVGESGSIGNQFYNNTIYWNHGYDVNAVEQGTWGTAPTSGTDIYNNIFYGNSGRVDNNEGIHYFGNCVYGGVENAYPVEEDKAVVIADPGFTDTEKGSGYTDGTLENGEVVLGSTEGFALTEDSPCIDAGMDYMNPPAESLPAVSDELVDTHITIENRDYAGNTTPYEAGNEPGTVDIGAYEYQGKRESTDGSPEREYLKQLVQMANAYNREEYTDLSYDEFREVLSYVKAMMNRPVGEDKISEYIGNLEDAIKGLRRLDCVNSSDTAENILGQYHAEQGKDNAGFEKGSSDWGTWQGNVYGSIKEEAARTGTRGMCLEKWTGDTGYLEISDVPVKGNTDYILEGWVYTKQANGDCYIGVKHHNSVTGNKDHQLGKGEPSEETENGWKKVKMEFTTEHYSKISVSLGSNTETVWMDDVSLYEKYGSKNVDTKALEELLELETEAEEVYTEESWKNYREAENRAKLLRIDVAASQEEIDTAVQNLQAAYDGLKRKGETESSADNASLNLAIIMAEEMEKQQKQYGIYTEDSWDKAETALIEAKELAEDADASQEKIDAAFLNLITACNLLENDIQRVGLLAAINGTKAILSDEEELSRYEVESVQKVRKALEEAERIYIQEAATQETVNLATRGLLNSVTALVVEQGETRLDILVQLAEKILDSADQYTKVSIAELEKALEEAKSVQKNSQTSEIEILNAYNRLAEAMTGLVRLSEKSELRNAVEKACGILENSSKYVKDTITGLEEETERARGVLEDENADASAVGEAVKGLVSEILKARLLGDVDNNGDVDSADAAETLKFIAEKQDFDELQKKAADVNCDGEQDGYDVVEILRTAAEK